MAYKTISAYLSISLFAICGCLFRIFLGILFGTYCEEPDLYRDSWLIRNGEGRGDAINDSSNAFCVTTSGIFDQYGGALFIDLPANILGCFFMGFLQSGGVLGIPSDTNLAFLPFQSKVQQWAAFHLGLRTGLCGSLTTFSSWNTQMVVMLVGTTTELGSQGMSTFFGYMIGLQAAMASYVFGKHCAMYCHRRVNTSHAREEDRVLEQKQSLNLSAADHHQYYEIMPDFERHFLQDILDRNEIDEVRQEFPTLVSELDKWKNSTQYHRTKNFSQRQELCELETVIIQDVDGVMPNDTLLRLAEQNGWEVTALCNYMELKKDMKKEVRSKIVFSGFIFTCIMLVVFLVLFLIGLNQKNDEGEMGFNQMLCISGIFAPFGALCRWKLGALNGKLSGEWKWLPLGTLTANVLACIISISIQCQLNNMPDQPEDDFTWKTLMLKGVQTGFAGCLSTVSTFAAETTGLMSALPKNAWCYKYSFGSLGLCCLISVAIFAMFSQGEEDSQD